MKHKPIRIDWDELEVAFNNQNEELVYYLDLVTGHVGLEGEGEEDDFGDRNERYETSAQPSRDDSTRAYIDPLDADSKLEWMRRFTSEVDNLAPEVLDAFKQACDAEDSTAAIQAALRQHAEARDRWYLYRAERLRDRMTDWLDERGVTAIDPPPWQAP